MGLIILGDIEPSEFRAYCRMCWVETIVVLGVTNGRRLLKLQISIIDYAGQHKLRADIDFVASLLLSSMSCWSRVSLGCNRKSRVLGLALAVQENDFFQSPYFMLI